MNSLFVAIKQDGYRYVWQYLAWFGLMRLDRIINEFFMMIFIEPLHSLMFCSFFETIQRKMIAEAPNKMSK